MDDNFKDIIDKGVKVERNNVHFKITQLKLTNYYWNSGEIDIGMPISTSIELICKYDFEKDILVWNKKISHTYSSLDNCYEQTTDSYMEEVENANDLISLLEKNDLRNLKNNYFTEKKPDSFTHWEIMYNTYFKIVGTYDQELEVFKKMSELLGFKKIMDAEKKKIETKIAQS